MRNEESRVIEIEIRCSGRGEFGAPCITWAHVRSQTAERARAVEGSACVHPSGRVQAVIQTRSEQRARPPGRRADLDRRTAPRLTCRSHPAVRPQINRHVRNSVDRLTSQPERP
jgi:hypothetical protein